MIAGPPMVPVEVFPKIVVTGTGTAADPRVTEVTNSPTDRITYVVWGYGATNDQRDDDGNGILDNVFITNCTFTVYKNDGVGWLMVDFGGTQIRNLKREKFSDGDAALAVAADCWYTRTIDLNLIPRIAQPAVLAPNPARANATWQWDGVSHDVLFESIQRPNDHMWNTWELFPSGFITDGWEEETTKLPNNDLQIERTTFWVEVVCGVMIQRQASTTTIVMGP